MGMADTPISHAYPDPIRVLLFKIQVASTIHHVVVDSLCCHWHDDSSFIYCYSNLRPQTLGVLVMTGKGSSWRLEVSIAMLVLDISFYMDSNSRFGIFPISSYVASTSIHTVSIISITDKPSIKSACSRRTFRYLGRSERAGEQVQEYPHPLESFKNPALPHCHLPFRLD